MKTHLITLISFLMVSGLFADPNMKGTEPITELNDIHTKAAVFTDASITKPLVLKSLKNGSKYFDEKSLTEISKAVDFEKYIVLVFAWKGSGQDRLDYIVLESFPEQIAYTYTRGRTKDLRPHVKVYVLRSNVKWSVQQP